MCLLCRPSQEVMRKSSVLSVKTRAWKALSRYVRSIEKRCCTCGGIATEAGHWKHNGDKPNKNLGGNMLWYEIRNIHAQCPVCNRWKSGDLAEYAIFLEEKYGRGILQELQKLYNTPYKWTIEEIEGIAIHYEELLTKKGVVY